MFINVSRLVKKSYTIKEIMKKKWSWTNRIISRRRSGLIYQGIWLVYQAMTMVLMLHQICKISYRKTRKGLFPGDPSSKSKPLSGAERKIIVESVKSEFFKYFVDVQHSLKPRQISIKSKIIILCLLWYNGRKRKK